MTEGLVTDGVVDGRDIRDIRSEDVAGYDRCHFFAGILGWELALQWAGWPEDLPVWSASLPCQPFSVAGKGLGEDDERHLWPHFRKLVEECRPLYIVGEQVGSKAGRAWFSGVQTDLESLGYWTGVFDLPAAGVGKDHIRQRLFWLAHSGGERRQQERRGALGDEAENGGAGRYGGKADGDHFTVGDGEDGGLADSECHEEHKEQQESYAAQRGRRSDRVGGRGVASGLAYSEDSHGRAYHEEQREASRGLGSGGGGDLCGMADLHDAGHAALQFGVAGKVCRREIRRRSRFGLERGGATGGLADAQRAERREIAQEADEFDRYNEGRQEAAGGHAVHRKAGGPWGNAVWIPCADGKARRIESGLEPLAPGLPRSMGRLLPEHERLAEMEGLSKQNLKEAKSNRRGRLSGYGNAIVPELAAEFLKSYLDVIGIK
jgi:DNA (cytosine-5)-methyltransferase 1